MKNLVNRTKPAGFGKGLPVLSDSPLCQIGNTEEGGILSQTGNSCGTCCATAILNYFGIQVAREQIDSEIRNFNIFTAPNLLVRYLREKGLEATFLNEGSIEELIGYLERNIPVILLVDTRPYDPLNPFHMHYVVAISSRKGEDGFHFGFYNPWGLREEITEKELEDSWSKLHIGPFICWDRALIPVAPPGTPLPPQRKEGAFGVGLLGDALANFVNGIAHLVRDRNPNKGLKELALSLPQFLLGSSLFLLEHMASFASGNPPRR
ncbi:MAG: C39 family peptidase [Actinomycetota bacterium]|nr:C39 family peptidase [Actinomycetota bacterium]